MRFLIFIIFMSSSYANEAENMPDGRVISPYKACANNILVEKSNYKENQSKWDQFAESCNEKILAIDNFGLSDITSLETSVEYLDFLSNVANKINVNLDRSRQYANCSASCFTGKKFCTAVTGKKEDEVDCELRKKEVLNGLRTHSKKLKMELALAKDGQKIGGVNVTNVLKVKEDKLINSELKDFEIGLPNPMLKTKLSPHEFKEARRRLKSERDELEKEYKKSGYGTYHSWMSLKMMKRFEEHQERYRQILYEEAPILAVIESPKNFDKNNNPTWSDDQIAKAFTELSGNALKTKEKINWSLSSGKLEFKRYNGEAFGEWLGSMIPGKTDHHDLLYYIGMTNQVEEILKDDPSKCAIATALYNRLSSRGIQNAGLGFVASLGSLGVASKGVGLIFKIGRGISGSEAAALTGFAIGSVYLGDSFHHFNSLHSEATSKSGLSKDEGVALGDGRKMEGALDGVKLSIALAPVDAAAAWGASKIIYNSLAKRMEADLPEFAALSKEAKFTDLEKEQLVDKWLQVRIANSLKSGILGKEEERMLRSNEGRNIIRSLIMELDNSKKDFSNVPKELDFSVNPEIDKFRKEIALLKAERGKRKFKIQDLVSLAEKIFNGPLHVSHRIQTPLIKIQGRSLDPSEDLLKTGKIVSSNKINSEGNSTSVISFEDGTKGIWKPYDKTWSSNYRAEVLAYELDRKFGFNLVPPTVERTIDGKKGTIQLFKDTSPNQDFFKETLATQSQLKKQSLFDYLINNGDRHEKNYLISPEGNVISIDNGISFTNMGLNKVSFAKREEDILQVLKTEEGRQIVENLKASLTPGFRSQMVDYLGFRDASRLEMRIRRVIKLSAEMN